MIIKQLELIMADARVSWKWQPALSELDLNSVEVGDNCIWFQPGAPTSQSRLPVGRWGSFGVFINFKIVLVDRERE